MVPDDVLEFPPDELERPRLCACLDEPDVEPGWENARGSETEKAVPDGEELTEHGDACTLQKLAFLGSADLLPRKIDILKSYASVTLELDRWRAGPGLLAAGGSRKCTKMRLPGRGREVVDVRELVLAVVHLRGPRRPG